MHPSVDDTDPKTREVMYEILRRKTLNERLALGLELNAMLEAFVEADVRAFYPHADDREIFLRVAARRLPREWMIRVYGWDPQKHA